MRKHDHKFHLIPFIVLVGINLAIGLVASLFTRPQIPGWYAGLHKPWFNPPSWLFAPVWTTIYILIAIAGYLVWVRQNNSVVYRQAVLVYFVQLALNFAWSIIFFGMHGIFAAIIVILLLWISIIVNMVYFNKFTKAAMLLLLPYLLWVTFASVLNIEIYLLNR